MWSPEYSRPPQDQNKLEPTKECLHFKWPLRALFRGCLELPERPNAPLHAQVARSVTSVAVICTSIPELLNHTGFYYSFFNLLIFTHFYNWILFRNLKHFNIYDFIGIEFISIKQGSKILFGNWSVLDENKWAKLPFIYMPHNWWNII